MFGSNVKRPTKINPAANLIQTAASPSRGSGKTTFPNSKRQEKIQAQAAVIEQQKWKLKD